MKGIHITPEPGFCYKTTCATGKVFINLTSHDAIGPPGVAKKLDANGEEVEGLNVPMSVGPLRAWKDKKGAACSVVDIIVHSSVLEDCKTDQVCALLALPLLNSSPRIAVRPSIELHLLAGHPVDRAKVCAQLRSPLQAAQADLPGR